MEKLTKKYLKGLAPSYKKKGYNVPKWIIFSYAMISDGWDVYLIRSKSTVSKYVYILKGKKELKIRFSNHKANFHKEMQNDCNFYVGVGHKGVVTTEELIAKLRRIKI